MKRTNLLAVLTLAAAAPTAYAANVEAGKAKASEVCASCHGITGISASDGFPNLAGQKAAYLSKALTAYRSGDRKAAIMNNMAANLSDSDIDNIAAYFAGLKPCP